MHQQKIQRRWLAVKANRGCQGNGVGQWSQADWDLSLRRHMWAWAVIICRWGISLWIRSVLTEASQAGWIQNQLTFPEYLLHAWWHLSHAPPHLFCLTPPRCRNDCAHVIGIDKGSTILICSPTVTTSGKQWLHLIQCINTLDWSCSSSAPRSWAQVSGLSLILPPSPAPFLLQ